MEQKHNIHAFSILEEKRKMIFKDILNDSTFQNIPLDDCLKRLMVQEAKAFDFAFYWESSEQVFEQVKSECDEIRCATNDAHLRDEMGDLLNACVSLCLYYGFDPRDIFKESLEKFQKRYDIVVQLAHEKGWDNLKHLTNTEKLDLWKEAKNRVTEHKF